jgi:hypothetical protein
MATKDHLPIVPKRGRPSLNREFPLDVVHDLSFASRRKLHRHMKYRGTGTPGLEE